VSEGKVKIMAKKRLNRKIALIGSMVFVFLGLVVIGVILHLTRDPEKFIRDGDAALKAADEARDEKTKTEIYGKAERNYHKARGLAKTDSLRVKILFKLADLYLKIDKWRNVLGCWSNIIQLEPDNAKARLGRLQYVYIVADTGENRLWQEVASQASDFIIKVADSNLLDVDTAKFESDKTLKIDVAQRIGPYLYLLRGRATLETVKMGAVTEKGQSLDEAIGDLEKGQELEPNNINAYWYLAQAVLEKGEIAAARGNFDERVKASERAKVLLEHAVKVADSDVRAHINLLTIKPLFAQMNSREQLQTLEPEYLSLVQRFNSSAEAFSALAGFYMRLGPKNLDKASETVEKAASLDEKNVAYAMNAAELYYRKFSIYGQEPDFNKAIEKAENALTLPDAQDKPGPRQMSNKGNRIWLYDFLARCYSERLLEAQHAGKEENQKWLAEMETTVHQIEQLIGAGEEPRVVKWKGMLELVKGDKNVATKRLYEAYEQNKAAGRRDARLSYTLAGLFENTTELGAVNEFLASALGVTDRGAADKIDASKPEAILDYADLLLKMGAYENALNTAKFFENEYWSNKRSQILRIRANIGANQFDEAEKEIAELKSDQIETTKLQLELVQAKIRQIQRAIERKRMEGEMGILLKPASRAKKEDSKAETADAIMSAELKGYKDSLASLAEKLLKTEPNSVREYTIVAACENYIAEGKVKAADDLVSRFLEYSPDSTTGLFYKRVLAEPEPGKIPEQRRREIEKEVVSGISDPIRRAFNLGMFYQRNNEPNEAIAELKKALELCQSSGDAGKQGFADTNSPLQKRETKDKKIKGFERAAAASLFDIAVEKKNWELAEQTAGTAKRENFDDCEGKFFAARLAAAREQYKDAIAMLDDCLKQKPVFSYAFMLRSGVNAALGNESVSIEDAQKAAALNPLDGDIAKRLMRALYRRNQRLGQNVSSEQLVEAKTALEKALALNLNDLELLGFYADNIIPTEPLRALAIRQNLQKIAPSAENALMLGRLAGGLAVREADAERKDALFAIAESALEQARKINPHDETTLSYYAEYYRLRGHDEKARQLLAESQDKKALWGYYFRGGHFEQAKGILEQIYQENPKDSNAVRGLLLVAEGTGDTEGAKKYSEELVSLEDNVENNLLQVQTLLRTGLLREAQYKLQSVKEKYPKEPRTLLLEALAMMKLGQLKKAMELTNQNLGTNQNNAMAWRLKGEINILMANYEQAIIDLKKSKSLSDEPITRLSLSKAYMKAKQDENAVTELKTTIDLPEAPAEARTLLGQIYLKLGRKGELKKLYDETLKKFPDSTFWCGRAAAFAMTEGDTGKAEELYRQALQKGQKDDRSNTEALDGYLQVLIAGGKLDKVFEEGAKYTDSNCAPVAFLRMAEAKSKLGDKENALQYGRKALTKIFTAESRDFEINSDVLQRLSTIFGAEEVTKNCKELLDANPRSITANLAMFNLMRINGEYNKAVGYIDKCLELAGADGNNTVDYSVQKALVLQAAYLKTSDNNYLKRAITEYESLLSKMPNNASVLNNLAYILAENNERLADALEYARRAHEANPNNPDLMDTYAYVLYKNGKYSDAATLLQSALQQYEAQQAVTTPDVYEHLGMVKEKLGVKAEAFAAYKQALDAGRDTLSEKAKERVKAAVERVSQQEKTADK
jgi:tetratricopeptide (TPR) repeat protein